MGSGADRYSKGHSSEYGVAVYRLFRQFDAVFVGGKVSKLSKIPTIDEGHSNVAIYERPVPCRARCCDNQCEATISCGVAVVTTSYSRRHEPRQIPLFGTNIW